MRFKKTENSSAGVGFVCKKKFPLFNIVTGISIAEKLRFRQVFLLDDSASAFVIYRVFFCRFNHFFKFDKLLACSRGFEKMLTSDPLSITGSSYSGWQNIVSLMARVPINFTNSTNKKSGRWYRAFYVITIAAIDK